MTAAHTTLLAHTYALLAATPCLVICRGGTRPGEIVAVDFDRRTIKIALEADLAEFVGALAYGIRHMHRGPCYEGDEADAERVVAEEVARMLAPAERLPANLDTADPRQVAAELGIDVDTARRGIALAVLDQAARVDG